MLGPEEACDSCQIKPKIDSPGILRARPVWMLCLRAGARAKRINIAHAIGTEAVGAQRTSDTPAPDVIECGSGPPP